MQASDMILSPLDASRHDDSDDMCFIFLQSLDDEILHFNNLVSGLSQYFWQVSVLWQDRTATWVKHCNLSATPFQSTIDHMIDN